MNIVDVIPITKSLGKETLSYFCAKPVALGSMVTIPLRKKEVHAVVVARHDVAKVKSALKSAEFTLRNVLEVYKTSPFSEQLLRACIRLKNFLMMNPGTIMKEYTSQDLITNESLWHQIEHKEITKETNILPERHVLQASFDDRISYYKTYIREQFASNQSLCIICPTQQHVINMETALAKGISDRILVLHSKMTKKKKKETLQELQTRTTPIVYICTPTFITVPRDDIDTYILEQEGSRYYVRQTHGGLDDRHFIKAFTYESHAKLILADSMLQWSTIHEAREHHYHEIRQISFTIRPTAEIQACAWPDPEDEKNEDYTYSSCTPDTLKLLEKQHKTKHTTLLYVRRTGLAPITVCKDCGEVVTDPDGHTPLILHKKTARGKTESVYRNPVTGVEVAPNDTCSGCGGWRLQPLGIATQRVLEDVSKALPDIPTYIIDGKTTPKDTDVAHVRDEWQTSGGILIATEKALPCIDIVDTIVVMSLESLLALPTYRSYEFAARTLSTLSQRATQSFIIQTKHPEQPMATALQKKNFIDIYNEDNEDRKNFSFPPYARIITIRKKGALSTLKKKRSELDTALSMVDLHHSIRPGKKKNQYELVSTFHTETPLWIDVTGPMKNPSDMYKKIFRAVESLPIGYMVSVE